MRSSLSIILLRSRYLTESEQESCGAEAKELPKPEISKMEFDMKDVNIRQSIKNTERNVEKLEERMIRMEDKIDQLR